ncbi:MAG: DUF523 domain-containing protein [Candidatus Moranbacteria bacterium]|jgi:uncharacterized protein YbbK (DUF523 family)|nr:DUF523 domain-containing protein [Candidatus Moranbacteria bacterium]
MKLCSACLLGINCRYNGERKANKKVLELANKETLIPVCPEQLGGLATPRHPAEARDGRVFDKTGADLTERFEEGAREVLKIAQLYGIKEAILKQRSPSCGCGQVYDGSFSGTIIQGDGKTAALLKKHGIVVMTEEDWGF